MRPGPLLLTLVAAALAAGCPRPQGRTTPDVATPAPKPGADLTASGDTPGAVTGTDDSCDEALEVSA